MTECLKTESKIELKQKALEQIKGIDYKSRFKKELFVSNEINVMVQLEPKRYLTCPICKSEFFDIETRENTMQLQCKNSTCRTEVYIPREMLLKRGFA